MRKIQIFLFLTSSLFSILAFDCSGILESGCKDFTYAGTFLKTPEERVEALSKFYEKYFSNTTERRNLSFELDSNKRIHIKSNEEIQENSPIFIYQLDRILAQRRPDSMDFSQFIDKLERFLVHTISVSAKIGHSKFWDMKAKAIQLFWFHVAQRNDSKFGDYLNTLEEEVFSPYLQFKDEEVDILKNIHEDYAHTLNMKRNYVKTAFDTFHIELYTHYNREILYTMMRYPNPETNVRLCDYIFMEYFIGKYIYIKDNSVYLIPFLDLISDDYSKSRQFSIKEHIKIKDVSEINTHTLTFLSDYLIDQDSLVSQEYRKSAESLFIYDGTFDKNHPQECENIPLWEHFMEGFKMTMGHANLYYYLPFPSFGICYLNPEEDNHKITLLIRSLNMNEEQAQHCYNKARELQKIKGLSGKELYQGLEEVCEKPELKLNSRDIAKAEIDMKLKKYELILEKIKKATQKNEANNLPVKNLNFLNEYVTFKYNLIESAQIHINSLPFVISEMDLKQQKLMNEQMEQMKEQISFTVHPNRNKENKEENSEMNEEEKAKKVKKEEATEEEEDEDFKLEEKNEL